MRSASLFALAICAAACAVGAGIAAAQERAPALTGRVSSAAEGAMEGVLVSARKAGSPITVTVVSERDGRYRFPAGRLSSGRYELAIRAVGYELDAPRSAEITATAANVDLNLRPAKDLAAQLTNTEWLISMPGTAEQKRPLIECMSCHTYERVMRSADGADALFAAIKRMPQYANNSTIARVQPRVAARTVHEETLRRTADYLATVNLSRGATWPFKLKTLPRPRARHTRHHHRIRHAADDHRAARRRIDAKGYRLVLELRRERSRPARSADAESMPNSPIRKSSRAFHRRRSRSKPTETATGGWHSCSSPASSGSTSTPQTFRRTITRCRRNHSDDHAAIDCDAGPRCARRRQGVDQRRQTAAPSCASIWRAARYELFDPFVGHEGSASMRPTVSLPTARTTSISWNSPTRISAGSTRKPAVDHLRDADPALAPAPHA